MFISNGFTTRGFINNAGRFVQADPNNPPAMMGPLADVTPRNEATIFSNGTGGGDWNSTGTWAGGSVPGASDKVVILTSDTVTLKGNNAAQVDWVLVEGTIDCDTAADSFIRVGSLSFATGASMEFGTLASPLPSGVTAEIQIADLGDIDVTQDTWTLGRGINFAMGSTMKVYGAGKDHWAKMTADAAVSDTSVVMDRNLVDAGWKVGDMVVIGNDTYDGWGWDGSATSFNQHRSEERTITSFSTTSTANDTVNFTGGLSFTHAGNATVLADGGLPDLRPYVFNMTRNVRFTTENPGTIERHQRPHLMFHPNSNCDARYVEVIDFGRTHRGQSSLEAWEFDAGTLTASSNVNGRYGWHFHFVGTSDADMKAPPIMVGVVVRGSSTGGPMPGWGIAQHQSCGEWYRCIVYLSKGSGMAAEDGNERGIWKDCGAMSCEGYNTAKTKNWATGYDMKMGHNGSGFFTAGRVLRLVGCVTHDCQWGFDAFHRPSNRKAYVPLEDVEIPQINLSKRQVIDGESVVSRNDQPIRHWTENTAIGCRHGLEIHKAVHVWPSQRQSVIRDFTYWNKEDGPKVGCIAIDLEYTAGYIVLNPLVVRADTRKSNEAIGFKFGKNTVHASAIDPHFIECGYDIMYAGNQNSSGGPYGVGRIINRVFNPTSVNPTVGQLYDNDPEATEDDNQIVTTAPPANTFSISDIFTASEDTSSTTRRIEFSGSVTDYYGTYSWPVGTADSISYRKVEQFEYILDTYGYWQNGANNTMYIPMMWSDRRDATDHAGVFEMIIDGSGVSVSGKTNNGAVASPATAPNLSNLTTTATANTPTSAISTKTVDLSTAVNSADGTDRYYLVGSTDWGQVVNNGDGTISYIPDIGFTGDDVVTFWVWDGQQGISKASCTITVS